ncbi:MAG: hypothetical protein KKF46_07760 [Nanoarchaeota archaeon]|nr:hypothetical protein [Nanoarchaeota archaeon]MBU1322224.1 hypothetical protein [Nanoarchaeota archaeon]MBU1597765.1 hypothetical protein [Nanoarchaeota archaeon]MBU2442029.1 hypothetical protein [Nanoarchaeota archaeon]
MSKKLTQKELANNIVGYIKRAEEDESIKILPFEKEGLYEIVSGGQNEMGSRSSLGLYQGKYIDALAYLMNSGEYFGWWVSQIDHSSNGYVAKAKINTLETTENIASPVKKLLELDRKRAEIDKEIEKLNGQKEALK